MSHVSTVGPDSVTIFFSKLTTEPNCIFAEDRLASITDFYLGDIGIWIVEFPSKRILEF